MNSMHDDPSSEPTPHSPWWQGRRGEWYVVLQGILFLVILAGPWIAPASDLQLSAATDALRIAGGVFIAAGALIAIAAALSLGRNLTPLPHPIDSATPERRVQAGAPPHLQRTVPGRPRLGAVVQQRRYAARRGGAVRFLRHQVAPRRALADGAIRQ